MTTTTTTNITTTASSSISQEQKQERLTRLERKISIATEGQVTFVIKKLRSLYYATTSNNKDGYH